MNPLLVEGLADAIGFVAGSFAAGLQRQFTHVEWEGFRFYDFIFPLFHFF